MFVFFLFVILRKPSTLQMVCEMQFNQEKKVRVPFNNYKDSATATFIQR